MPKQPNVTNADLKATEERAFDLSQDLSDIATRLERGYVETPLENGSQLARSFGALASSALDLQRMILVRMALEDKTDLEAKIRAKIAAAQTHDA